jgi:hypothetical protein
MARFRRRYVSNAKVMKKQLSRAFTGRNLQKTLEFYYFSPIFVLESKIFIYICDEFGKKQGLLK